MLIIDDAGGGNLIGGEVIACLRTETNQFEYEVLNISAYKYAELWRNSAAKLAVLSLREKIQGTDDEELVFCTGDIFGETKLYLSEIGRPWREEKIVGDLQDFVEDVYFNTLVSHGFPEKYRFAARDYKRFNIIASNWALRNLQQRSVYCKPLRLEKMLLTQSQVYGTLVQHHLTCAACLKTIPLFTAAVMAKDGENMKLFHHECHEHNPTLNDYHLFYYQDRSFISFILQNTRDVKCATCQQPLKTKRRVTYDGINLFHHSCFAKINEIPKEISLKQ
ncbi:MAG: hypothetical protein Q8N36_01455 [bacterium]|nr:hypothetical protein [bacterium]